MKEEGADCKESVQGALVRIQVYLIGEGGQERAGKVARVQRLRFGQGGGRGRRGGTAKRG